MIQTHKIFLFLVMLILSPEAFASTKQWDGDMFYKGGWIYDRPSVPSDRVRSVDVFPAAPVFYNKNADMFDHANKVNIIGREDMLPTRRIAQVPVHILKID